MQITKLIQLINDKIENNLNKEYRIGIDFLESGKDKFECQYNFFNLEELIKYEYLMHEKTNKTYIRLTNINTVNPIIIKNKDYNVDEIITTNLDATSIKWLTFDIYCSAEDLFIP